MSREFLQAMLAAANLPHLIVTLSLSKGPRAKRKREGVNLRILKRPRVRQQRDADGG